jgi:hypothetical protein
MKRREMTLIVPVPPRAMVVGRFPNGGVEDDNNR